MLDISTSRFGTFQAAGLLAPVPAGTFNPKDFVASGTQAVTFGGQAYAIPVMLDTYTLVHNKKLVQSAPKTFSQLMTAASRFPNKKGKTYGFMFDISNFYYAYAFFRGYGSYVFNRTGGGLNSSDIGLNNAGGVKTLSLFQSLVRSKRLIPQDVDYTTAQSFFQKGQLGMFVDGDWDITANHQALGKNFAAAPLPGGGAPHPFAGVQVAFASASSPNKALVFDLFKYMSSRVSIPDYQAAGRIPARKADLDNPIFRKDAVLSVYAKAAATGDSLPNSCRTRVERWAPRSTLPMQQ